mgnify:CR=1 FL=1
MIRMLSFLGAALLVILMTHKSAQAAQTDVLKTNAGDLDMVLIGHGTLYFVFNGKVYHVDPWSKLADYTALPKADVALITHEHKDHLDPGAIMAVSKPETKIIVTPAARDMLDAGEVMQNGDVRELPGGVRVEAVPAYNIVHKREGGEPFHPKGRGNGYVFTFGDKKVYVAGDTEDIPEMAKLTDIDVAFLPMNLPYTMTPEMAAKAARSFKPKVLYPYHYGETDPQKLVDLLKDSGIEVRVREMR